MNFKSIFAILMAFAMLLVIFTMTGCVNEEVVNLTSSSDSRKVSITVSIPGQQSPLTRSIDGAGGEAVVKDIDILVFEQGTSAGTDGLLAESVEAEIVSQGFQTDGSYKVEFKALLTVNARATTLAVVANAREVVQALPSGDTKDNVYNQLIYASENAGSTPEGWKWKANNGNPSAGTAVPGTDYTPIPMHGEYQLPTGGVREGMNINDMSLIRMLVRIDVQNNAAGFTLKNVYLTNYNTMGMIVSGGGIDGAPVLNIPYDPAPRKGSGNALCYAYPATGGLEGEIYTYEAAATDGKEGTAGHTDATCLIIEGHIGGDNTPYFYRIDFTATTDAAGKKPGDPGFDPVTVQYMPLYRNHRYAFDITGVVGAGYASFDDALKSLGMNNNLKVSLLVVDESKIKDIVYNGKHFLGIGEDVSLTSLSGDVAEIPCVTNYAYGWQVDTSKGVNGIEYVTGTGWLEAVKNGQQSDKKANLKLTTKAGNDGITPREASVYLKAGTLVHKVKVIQRERDLYLKIVDSNGNEITELVFSEKANTNVSPQGFTVQWGPATSPVTVTNTPQGTFAFPGGGATGVPVSGTLNGSGASTYTILPPAMTSAELQSDPFKEKKSLLNFSVSNDGMTESKNLLLCQLVYNLVVVKPSSFYRLDGSTYTLRVRSNTDWKIKSVTEQVTSGTGPLLNLAAGDNLRTTTTGSADTSTGTAVTFRVTNNMNNNLRGNIVVVFENPAGLFSDVSVKLDLSGEYYPAMHSGWAGSNIYWDGSKFTFDDVGDHSHENYQGVYFQWGSLWGIAPNGGNNSAWSTNMTVYKLSNGVHSASNTGNGWNSFPRVSDINISSTPPSGKSARDRHYLYEITDGSAGIGDICKYLTEQAGGSIHGKKWRMPTSQEFDLQNSYSRSGTWAYVTSNNAAGQYQNPNVPGYRKSDAGTPFFPASGYRFGSNGQLFGVGNAGYYWSGSPTGTHGYGLDFSSGNVYPANGDARSSGFSVRCVAE